MLWADRARSAWEVWSEDEAGLDAACRRERCDPWPAMSLFSTARKAEGWDWIPS